jgi:lipoprotein-releasing system permease protein
VVEDLTRAYAPRAELMRFAATLSGASEIAVKAESGVDVDALAEAVARRLEPYGLGAAFDSPVRTWRQQSADILEAIDEQREVLDLCLFCIVVVAGFNLLVSLHLLVTEKLRDVGTLAALGGSPLGIASIFTALGVLVTAIGALVGGVAGVVLTRNVNEVHDALTRWTGRRLWSETVYFFDEIPVEMAPQLVGMAILGTFGVTLLFAFLGSLRVARLDPVETLRHEG